MNPELFNAAFHGSQNFSAKLKGVLDSTTDPEQLITSGQKNTVLHIAAKTGKLHIKGDDDPVLRFLYDQNKKGDTPLHIAAKLGNLEMTRILVAKAKKADVEQNRKLLSMVNHEKDTALHEAVRHNRFEVVKLLIEGDKDLASIENTAGESPLFIAVDRYFFRVAFYILDSAPDCSFAGRRGMNVLHAAVIRSESWKVYTVRGAVLLRLRNMFDGLGLGQLYSFRKPENLRTGSGVVLRKHHLIVWGNEHLNYLARYLLKSFPNLSNKDRDIVDELLKDRLLMEKADDFGWIPLHYASYIGHMELVDQLLANSNRSLALTRTKQGMSSLHISAKSGHVDVIKLLIEKCPEICELLDEEDQTALHVAVEKNRKDVVKFFIESLAFQDLVNEKDKNGNTALHIAASMIDKGYIKILAILAHDSNIDKGAINKAGMTFLDIVMSNKQLKRSELYEIMTKLEREIFLLGSECEYVRSETKKINQSGTYCETKKDEIKVEEKGGKVVDNHPTTDDIQKPKQKYFKQVKQVCKEVAAINIVIVTIIASVTFTALFAMPGGYNEEGLLILNGRSDLQRFLAFDSLSFVFSATSMAIHFVVPLLKELVGYLYLMMWTLVLSLFSLVTMILAFNQGRAVVLHGKSDDQLTKAERLLLASSDVSFSFNILLGVFVGLEVLLWVKRKSRI